MRAHLRGARLWYGSRARVHHRAGTLPATSAPPQQRSGGAETSPPGLIAFCGKCARTPSPGSRSTRFSHIFWWSRVPKRTQGQEPNPILGQNVPKWHIFLLIWAIPARGPLCGPEIRHFLARKPDFLVKMVSVPPPNDAFSTLFAPSHWCTF